MKRFALFAIAVLTLCAGFTAPAAKAEPAPPADVVAAPSAPSLFAGLFTPANVAEVVFGLFGVVVGGKAILSVVWKRRIALILYHSFHAAEDAAAETEGEDAFDKVAAALKWADEYCLAKGWRALKPEEKALLQLGYKTVHGAQVAQAKVMARAQEMIDESRTQLPPRPFDQPVAGDTGTSSPQ